MCVEFVYSGVSLQNRRSSNMDSLLLKCRSIKKESALLAVVCDGVGGLADGAFASGEAARLLGEWFDGIDDTNRIGLKMRDEILKINSAIATEAIQRSIQTASTLSVVLLLGEQFFIVHVGDSRVYAFANDSRSLSLLTSDDVSESGKLTMYIGQPNNITLQYSEGSSAGKTFLVCSDGIYKRMDARFLSTNINADNANTVKNSVKVLTQYVIDRGEQDNITIALMKTINY